MRFVTYAPEGGAARPGLVLGHEVIDVQACAERASTEGDRLPSHSLKALLGVADLDDLRRLEDAAATLMPNLGVPVDDVRLLAPVPDADKVLCIGLNYKDHVDEARDVVPALEAPPDPIVFSKFNSALIGHGEAIRIPAAAPDMIDWEGELAVVIGRHCSRTSASDALDYVAGYTVLNDVSARDVQLGSPQWLMGKSFDTSGPCGPWIVTRDEIPNPQDLRLTTTVNGELMQQTTTALMIHPIARLIEYISSLITLSPGDVIATGTPGGIGYARDPKVFLAPGDTVKIEVEGVGELVNAVIGE
jgi:acylpyruvate hydrolase